MTSSPTAQGAILYVVGWMVLSTVLSTGMQAGIRLMADGMHPFEIAFFRNALPLIFMAGWLSRVGWSALRTGNVKLHLVRGAVNAGAMLCFFTGVTIAPFATVTALGFTAPLFAALGAALFLGETMRIRRWIATLIGFAGVLIIVRPGYVQIGLGETLLLVAACCWSIALLLIKTMSRTDSAWTITIYMNILLTPLTLPFALYVWVWPTPTQLVWLAVIAALGTLGQTALNHALRFGEIAFVTPMDFMRLVWASILGVYLFHEPTSVWTWIGGAIIIASTSYIAYRESVLRRTSPSL